MMTFLRKESKGKGTPGLQEHTEVELGRAAGVVSMQVKTSLHGLGVLLWATH